MTCTDFLFICKNFQVALTGFEQFQNNLENSQVQNSKERTQTLTSFKTKE